MKFTMSALVAILFITTSAINCVHAREILTIVHFNDLDRMNEENGRGGIARVASVIETQRKTKDNVIVTFGGDTISPSLMSGLDKGQHMIDLLNKLDLTAMVMGNHEYDFGPDIARQRISEATFPVLAANNLEPDGNVIKGAVPSIIVNVKDFKIGILGLTTVSTSITSSPDNIAFADPVQIATDEAERLREDGADLVIALAHTDLMEDADLIACRDVDIILSGDDHLLRTEYDGDVLFAESGEQAEWVTVISVAMERIEEDDVTGFDWNVEYAIVDTANVSPSPTLVSAVKKYEEKLSDELNVELGITQTAMDTRREIVRMKEAAFGNLIADAIREATGADFAAINGGGIRAKREYAPGTILTRRDIVSELPFGNRTVVLEITGRDFIDVLENSLSEIEKKAGRFLHISGASVRYNLSQPVGERVTEVMLNDNPIELNKTYTFAVNDYIAAGGDGFSILRTKKRIVDENAAVLMTVQVFDYIQSRGEISPKVDGRLIEVN